MVREIKGFVLKRLFLRVRGVEFPANIDGGMGGVNRQWQRVMAAILLSRPGDIGGGIEWIERLFCEI